MASSSFLSSPAHSFSTPKFSQGAPPLSPPTSVKFLHSLPISASYTAEKATGSLHIASPSSIYDVLGIQTGATFQEIKSAYRKLARFWHPDVASNDRNDSSAADEFIRIHAAFATLSDPRKRADYDRTLLGRQRRAALTSSYTEVSGYRGRSWETDQCW